MDHTEERKDSDPENAFPEKIMFMNNMFLKESTYPENIKSKDVRKVIRNTEFISAGGFLVKSYITDNFDLIGDKGIMN